MNSFLSASLGLLCFDVVVIVKKIPLKFDYNVLQHFDRFASGALTIKLVFTTAVQFILSARHC